MSERTPCSVQLTGDWPSVELGQSYLPSDAPAVWRLDLKAFRFYAYLVSLGYSRDHLSPLPEHVGPALGLSSRDSKASFCTLCSAGLVILGRAENEDAPPHEIMLPLPTPGSGT